MKYLCVAEKPSIARSIAQILSGGSFTTRNSPSKYNKNFDFGYRISPASSTYTPFTVTSVTGHLLSTSFGELDKWGSCDPVALFTAPIIHRVSQSSADIATNLRRESRGASHLVIWTDCDREGEHIGAEIAEICRGANPRISVLRARFSAIIPAQIHAAARAPGPLDARQAAAVSARIDIDLRVGAALSRLQTTGLQRAFPSLSGSVISYGPCQFPTLGFVVDRCDKIAQFVPQPFWGIAVRIPRASEDSEGLVPDRKSGVPFSWARGHLFDEAVVRALYSDMEAVHFRGEVVGVERKSVTKWTPLPLTTVELQKAGTRLLKLSPKVTLKIADDLYQRGLLSYPRTETDQFDKDFDLRSLIEKQATNLKWSTYVQNQLIPNHHTPRAGKNNDKAHPPIHPTGDGSNLSGNEARVFDYVARRFLASCSSNARGEQTTVTVDIAGERFSASGLWVAERGFLDVFPFEKWSDSELPAFTVGAPFVPDSCEITQGQTSPPAKLTEADLVSLMDKNGIGTDATIAEHISKIIERGYVIKNESSHMLEPSELGTGLVKAYNSIGLEMSLTKPHLRRLTEARMKEIGDGNLTKDDMVNRTVEEYREMYNRTANNFGAFVEVCRPHVERYEGSGGVLGGGDGGGGGGGGGIGSRGTGSRGRGGSSSNRRAGSTARPTRNTRTTRQREPDAEDRENGRSTRARTSRGYSSTRGNVRGNSRSARGNGSAATSGSGSCYICGDAGHWANACPNRNS